MPEPQTLAAQHSAEIYTLLGFTCTGILGLLTMLYKRQNEDIKGAYDEVDAANARLDEGQKAFTTVGEQLVSIGARLTALEKDGEATNVELDRICADIKKLDHDLTVIQTEHNNCIRRLGK
jgi:septal ring factor EnvC (AmiA/AmiB activator)